MWNPYLGQGNFARFSPPTGVESVYPLADGPSGADTIVDLIGLDVYDGPDAADPARGGHPDTRAAAGRMAKHADAVGRAHRLAIPLP